VNPPQPILYVLPAGSKLIRLFDPTKFGATALSFRHFGPVSRFDHHRAPFPTTAHDADRGIIYAAQTLSGCLVEIFGDAKIVETSNVEVASLAVSRDLNLLDLRGTGAMNAGTVSAVCKDSNRQFSQAWSRFFYENTFVYRHLDGIIFGNAHNDENAFAFYERCAAAFSATAVCPLKDDALRVEILKTAQDNNMIVEPY